MVRMTQVTTAPTPSPSTPIPSHTSRSKTRPVFLSHHVDLFDEPNCDSTDAVPLDNDEFDPSPSSTFPSSSNSPECPKIFTPHQLWGEVPEDAKMPTITCKKVVEVANPKAHSTFGNPQFKHLCLGVNLLLNPSQCTFLTIILHQGIHIRMWINHVISVTPPASLTVHMIQVPWIPLMTICFIWILPVSHLNSRKAQVLKVLKLNLFLILRNLWTTTIFHQQMFSVNNMTMTYSYSVKRLIHHLTISAIRTLMSVKSEVKIAPSSFMPPTLATILHYPNS